MNSGYNSFMNSAGITPEAIGYQPMEYDIGSSATMGSPQGFNISSPGLGGGGNGFTNFLQSSGFRTGLDATKTALGLYNAFNANKMAKQQFKFTKNFANANLANQTQSYNTALQDRARSRGFVEGQSQPQIDSYVAQNRLRDRTV